MSVLNVTVANNVGFGDRQQTMWVRVALFGKRAEGELVNYLKKGQHVFISGELSQNEYRANDGTTKTSLELNANIIDLVGKKSDNQQQQPAQQNNQNNNQQNYQQQPQQPAHQNYEDFDSEIPF